MLRRFRLFAVVLALILPVLAQGAAIQSNTVVVTMSGTVAESLSVACTQSSLTVTFAGNFVELLQRILVTSLVALFLLAIKRKFRR